MRFYSHPRSSAAHRVLPFLQNQRSRPFGKNETFASRVEGTAGLFGSFVVRSQGSHRDKPA